MTKIKVSIVTETYYPEVNGVANTLKYWVEGLQNKGIYTQIIRPKQNPDDASVESDQCETYTVAGLPIPRYKELKFGLPCKRKLVSLWKKSPPSAIYVATEGPLGLSAVRAAKKLNIPILSGFHTNFQSYSKYYGLGFLEPLIFGFLRYFHNQTRGTIVPTKKQQEWLSRKGFENVSVLSRGIDSSRFTPSKRCSRLRERWHVTDGQVVCLYVGRVAGEKNIALAIKAYENVTATHPDCVFVVVGDGPLRKTLESEHPGIRFVGMKTGEELAKYYASADLFLFPSKTDTFGNVVTEAMASRLGIVAFNDAAAREHLSHGNSAYIANLDNDEAFIQLTLEAIESSSELEKIRENAYQLAQTITWNNIVNQFVKKLLEKPPLRLGDETHESSQNINSI